MASARRRYASVNEIHRDEVDRGHVIAVVRIREPVNVGFPAGGGHRDSEMVEHRTAADNRLSPPAVGPIHDAASVDE